MHRSSALIVLALLVVAFAIADHSRSLPVDHQALNVLRPPLTDDACAPCGGVCVPPPDDDG